jgi:phosphatidylinositol phospholipase C delta
MINHTMFLRNGRSGYVLKPSALRTKDKRQRELITKRTTYCLEIRVISAQQIPRPRDKEGREIVNRSTMDPYVQVSVHVPDWPLGPPTISPERSTSQSNSRPSLDLKRVHSSSVSKPRLSSEQPSTTATTTAGPNDSYSFRSGSTPAKVIRDRTGVVKNNGFNPIWEEDLKLKFEVAGDMLDLVFLKLSVRDEDVDDDEHALALYCISLGSLKQG